MIAYQRIIKDMLEKAVANLHVELTAFDLFHPTVEMHGDVSTNLALTCFALSKEKDSNEFASPLELAKAICAQIEPGDFVEKVEAVAPGFINLTFSKHFLISQAQEALVLGEKFGKNKLWQDKTVIVEYSSPNIAKPFTIGHLRSTIIGDAIAALFEFSGAKVYRDNHIGDWGTQFGKQIYALKHLGKGDLASNIESIKNSDNPVKELVALYVEFHEMAEENPEMVEEARSWFKKLESGDAESRELWSMCIDWSWHEFGKLYKKLKVRDFSLEFNDGKGLGESFFEDKMQPVIDELNSKKLLNEGKEGAKLVFFPNDVLPPAMILKKDGATLYHTRDLATDLYRKQHYNPDLIINEVGSEQSLYFRQLFEMEQMLGWYEKDQRVHVGHGLIKFKQGKMSTRKGNTIWLEDVLEEALMRAKALSNADDDVQNEFVSIGALKWNDLRRDPKHTINFDWDEMLTMDGNSGPYMQYTHARISSVLVKANEQGLLSKSQMTVAEIDLDPLELSVFRYLYRFPLVIQEATNSYSPHIVCTYLFALAQRFNSFYNKCSILGKHGEPIDRTQVSKRLLLAQATKVVLANGLQILGIEPLEKM